MTEGVTDGSKAQTPSGSAGGAAADPGTASAERVPWLDRVQRRFPGLGFPLAVLYKFFDDTGSYLSALIAYYMFVSLFPILLLASTVLSVVLRGHPALQRKLLQSALAELPVVGSQLSAPSALSGGGTGVVLSVITTLYGVIGAGQAFQYAANTIWQVPRNSRPNPFKSRGRSFLLLFTFGLGIVLTTAASSVVAQFSHLGSLGGAAVDVAAVIVNVGVFLLGFRLATSSKAGQGWRHALPGAVMMAVLWQLLQLVGVRYVQHVIAKATAINGVFATVLGLIMFLYVAANLVVLSMELNVVIARHLWPRALLTPFTDAVELTPGDERAYAGQAKSMRAKGFEDVDVSFDGDDQAARAVEAEQRAAARSEGAAVDFGAAGDAEAPAGDAGAPAGGATAWRGGAVPGDGTDTR